MRDEIKRLLETILESTDISDLRSPYEVDDIEEFLLESQPILNSINEMSDNEFVNFVESLSDENLSYLDEIVTILEDANLLNEGLIFGDGRGAIRKSVNRALKSNQDEFDTIKKDVYGKYKDGISNLKSTISGGFLNLNPFSARAKYIRQAKNERKQKLLDKYQKELDRSINMTRRRKGETDEEFTTRKLQREIEARKRLGQAGKEAKEFGLKSFERYKRGQEKSINRLVRDREKELRPYDKALKSKQSLINRVGQEEKDKDWRATSTLGKLYNWFDRRNLASASNSAGVPVQNAVNNAVSSVISGKQSQLATTKQRDEIGDLNKDLKDQIDKLKADNISEMTVAGVAAGAPDATSQGPLVWAKDGAGVMKTSPLMKFGKRKKVQKVDIEEGSQFGGYGVTSSGAHYSGTFQGHPDNLERKIKFKMKQREVEEKKEKNEKK